MTPEDKQKQLHLSLDDKIKRSKELILEWYLQYQGKVYVSFSGGKDSTVLLHLARNIKYCENIPAVFCDTGLEYPEVREHVKSVDNVIWIKPKLTFKQVIEQYGWPVVSKEQARYIHNFRHTNSEYIRNIRLNGTGKNGRSGKISQCWRPLINTDFEITSACCDVMKKRPMKNLRKKPDYILLLGQWLEKVGVDLNNICEGTVMLFPRLILFQNLYHFGRGKIFYIISRDII